MPLSQNTNLRSDQQKSPGASTKRVSFNQKIGVRTFRPLPIVRKQGEQCSVDESEIEKSTSQESEIKEVATENKSELDMTNISQKGSYHILVLKVQNNIKLLHLLMPQNQMSPKMFLGMILFQNIQIQSTFLKK